jgi:hypothetical protein
MVSKLRFATRLWFYFRIGYGTYLTFLLGAVNTLVVVWYLALREVPSIENLFGHFVPFAVVVTIIGVPLSVLIGWVHLKRSPAYSSEVDISVEANPYNYRLIPGYWREAFVPLYLELLVQLRRLMEAEKLLNNEEKARIEGIERKLRILVEGGSVGTPRTKI